MLAFKLASDQLMGLMQINKAQVRALVGPHNSQQHKGYDGDGGWTVIDTETYKTCATPQQRLGPRFGLRGAC